MQEGKLSSKLNKLLTIATGCLMIVASVVCFALAGTTMPEKISSVFSSIMADAEGPVNTANLKGVKINGNEYLFTNNVYEYNLTLPYYTEDLLNIEYLKTNSNQKVNAEEYYLIPENNKTISFYVQSADGSDIKNYILHLSLAHCSYLRNLEVERFELAPEYTPETTNYTISILKSVRQVNVQYMPYDTESTVTVTGAEAVANGSKITVKVTNPYVGPTTYTITCKYANTTIPYAYSGGYKEFVAPFTGMYEIECFGARGGTSLAQGKTQNLYGLGGYAKGDIMLKKGEKLYVYVGQTGTDSELSKDSAAAWNGGGLGTWDNGDDETSGAGGGATDIRLVPGNWNDSKSLASRIMVAGGGGGASFTMTGGDGGGILGGDSTGSVGGSQISGYAFGIGENGHGIAGNDGVAGGGGGYWGGRTADISGKSAGAGGSGYISGHPGCIAIKSETEIKPKVQTYNNLSDSYHYSGKVFTNTTLTSGVSTTPKVIIDVLSISNTYLVSNITLNNGTFTREFNHSDHDYYVRLDSEDPISVVTVETIDDTVTVENGKVQTIETMPGETVTEIKAISAEGIEEVYRIHFIRKPSSDSRLKSVRLDWEKIEGYDEDQTTYEITLPYYAEEEMYLDGIKKFPGQIVTEARRIDISQAHTVHTVKSISEDGQNTSLYTIILNRTQTTKLKFLRIINEDFARLFNSDITEYDYTVGSGAVSLNIEAIPYDKNAKVTIKGAGYIKEGKNLVTVTVSKEGVEDTVYTLNITKGENVGEKIYDFKSNGGYQTFVAQYRGYYKFEAWGARGGYSRINGRQGGTVGLGGYTSGVIRLNEGDTVYIYVGTKGTDAVVGRNSAGGYNGGGDGCWDNSDDESSGGGGGATDFRLVKGAWNSADGLASRVMVAAGGGGASWTYPGGSGGGLSGISYYRNSPPGTQTSGYKLGQGETGNGRADSDGVAGGGAGYWGGTTRNISYASSGSGGSSYISGHDGCSANEEFVFKDTVMIDGEGYEWGDSRQGYVQMPNPQGLFVNGNDGDGFARITLLPEPSQNNLLKEIQINKGTMTPDIDYDIKDYTVNVGPEDTEITIYGVVDDIKATIEGNGTYKVLPGDNIIKLKVTAESGDERIYTITVKRQASSNKKPINIEIEGLIESIINVNPIYGKLDPEEFDPNIDTYSMIVPSRIKKLTFDVTKSHEYQTVKFGVIKDGEYQEILPATETIMQDEEEVEVVLKGQETARTIWLDPEENEIVIDVIAENGVDTQRYTYNIQRDMSGNCMLEDLNLLNVDEEEVGFEFDQDVLEYFIEVENEVTYLDVEAIPEMEGLEPYITDTNLKVGLNDIYVIITAPNGEQLIYVIHAYRKQNGNVFLSYIKVKNGTEELALDPEYNKILDTYTVNVPNEIEEVNISAIAEAATSKIVEVPGGNLSTAKYTYSQNKTLKTGTNSYVLEVNAENGIAKGTYTININRDQSSNNYLKKLDSSLGSFDTPFEKTKQEYSITVPAGTKYIPLGIDVEDRTAKYEVLNNKNFTTGTNTVTVRVTAENGETRDYVITVEVEPSDNNYLLNILTSSGTLVPKFDKNTTSYTMEVENEVENLKVTAVKEDPSSTVAGEGTYALELGQTPIVLSVTAENGDTRNYEIEVTRKLNSNTNLLKVENDQMMPVTKVDKNNYTIEVPYEIEKLEITGTPEKITSTVTGNGMYPLAIGENTVTLTVKSEIGTTEDYTVTINRLKSTNCYLKSIFADECDIYSIFEKTKTNYNVKVLDNVQSLTLDIETESPEATYEVIDNENFVYGENRVYIKVTAADGINKRTYTLTVYRQPDIENRCDLQELEVYEGELTAKDASKKLIITPTFDAATLTYELTVPYEINKVTVFATALDNTATVEGDKTYELKVGLNVATVKVTSIENEEKTYQVKITREPSTNANLKSLDIQNHTLSPKFVKTTTIYEVETELTKLVINAEPEGEGATYEIVGNDYIPKGESDIQIIVTAQDGVTKKTYKIHVIRVNSSNCNLAYLAVNGYEMTPEFNKSKLIYNVNVPYGVNTVFIDAIPEDENATVVGNGSVTVGEGINTYEIVVTAETGAQKTYTVVINKGKSDNAYLSDIFITDGFLDPDFDREIEYYTVEVDYDVDNMTIIAFAEDYRSLINGEGDYELQVGNNEIVLEVIAPAGNKKYYTVNVVRASAISAKLSNLEVKDYAISPIFNEDIFDYYVSVDNEVSTLEDGVNLFVETLDPDATYIIKGDTDLKVGNNNFEIEVTSSDGLNKETYTLTVNRKIYSNNFLSYILPSKGTLDPTFSKTTINYNVVVENDVDEIYIDAEPEDSNATLTGVGNYPLALGDNEVKLEVTSGLGVKRTYTVHINRKRNSNNYLKSLSAKNGSDTVSISPMFVKTTQSYTIDVPVGTTKIQLFGEPENSLATVDGLGYVSLKAGKNIHTITVTAEDETTRDYVITINREASTINDLIDIIPSVGALDPSFIYGETEYLLVLGNADSLLSFTVSTQDRFATVTGHEEQQVPDGISTRTIVVKAENGDEKEYTIEVHKIRTDDARLKSLSVFGTPVEGFDSDKYSYTITVENNVKELTADDIEAEALYEHTKIYPDSKVELSVLKTNVYKIKTIAPDGVTTQEYILYVNKKKSSDSTLKVLEVAGFDIEPGFESDITEYKLVLPKGFTELKQDDVTAIPTDDYATVVKDGDILLANGKGTFNINVTSHDGSSSTKYTITVEVDKLSKSDNAYLSNIITSVGDLAPEFDREITSYRIELDNEVKNITLTGVKEVPYSTVSGDGTFALEVGEKDIPITVTAENGAKRTYNVKVIRKENSNKNLLRIDNDKDQIVTKLDDSTYQINVKNEIDEITITGIPEVETSTVEGNGKVTLTVGENKTYLTVTAKDGSSKEYTVIINREKSDNNYLKSVFAEECDIYSIFDKLVQNYTVKVLHDVDSLTLDIVPEDKDATYEVIGNENFVTGENTVIIRVTASDGLSKRDYKIKVIKQEDFGDLCDLIELTVDGVLVEDPFNPSKLVYEMTIPHNKTSVVVGAKALHEDDVTITGTGTYNELEVGLNVITVKVTGNNGEEKSYKIKITRELSDNAKLDSLVVQAHALTPGFDSDTIAYTLQTQLSKLVINAVPQEADATYEIIGNENLSNGENTIIIRVTAPNGTTTKDYTLTVTKVDSDNNNLASLEVEGYELTPTFNKSMKVYYVDVPNGTKTVSIKATADDENATVTGTGIKDVVEGKNVFEVKVTSESGNEKIYKVTVNVGESANVYLADLLLSQGDLDPVFNKEINNYTVEVPYEVSEVAVSGYPEDTRSTVTGNGTYSLNVGENNVELVVEAPNGDKNTYTLNITRKNAVSAKLSYLEVKNYKFVDNFTDNATVSFDSDTNDYYVSVNNEVTNLDPVEDMIIETLDPNATYVVTGNTGFEVGDSNVVSIEVTSSNGIDKETYTITVNRLPYVNNFLDYILPDKGMLSPKFVKTTLGYTIEVENSVTSIHIDAAPEDENATMVGGGDCAGLQLVDNRFTIEELQVGDNKFTIEVTSEGYTRTYNINVIRKKNSNNFLETLVATLGENELEYYQTNNTDVKTFLKTVNEYTIEVPAGTTEIELSGTLEEPDLATVTGLGSVKGISLGTNTHTITVTAEDGGTNDYIITIIRPASDENALDLLIPSAGTLKSGSTEGFVEGVTTYDLELGNDDDVLSFEVHAKDPFAEISGYEEQFVPNGKSQRQIIVKAEDEGTKTYTININRIRTDDARLSYLAVKTYGTQLADEFDPDVYEYTITVPNDKFVLTDNEIVAKPMYETTSIYPDLSVELSVLKLNTYEVNTVAGDGYTTQTYIINVIREKSDDSSLKKLSVAGYELTPLFDSETLEYKLIVPKGVDGILAENVLPVPKDEYATVVKDGDLTLVNGKGTYKIDVTSHDGTSNTMYKILVETAKSDDNYLESLTVNTGELSPEFDTNNVYYSLKVSEFTDEIDITAIPRDEFAIVVSGDGIQQIPNEGKQIMVMVQAEDEKLRAYFINVTKEPRTKATIAGKILTENVSNKHSSTIKLYKDNVLVSETTTKQDGSYKLYVDPGTYKVVACKAGYLDYTVEGIIAQVIEDDIVLDTYNLIAGDVVETGEIEIDDLVALTDNIGVTITEANKETKGKYDLNEDGVVNSADREILKDNYGLLAETVTWGAPISTFMLEMPDEEENATLNDNVDNGTNIDNPDGIDDGSSISPDDDGLSTNDLPMINEETKTEEKEKREEDEEEDEETLETE